MNMQGSKRKTLVFAGGFLVLLAVFSFADLAISKAVFNIESPFGIFFAAFGETPGVLVGCFCAAALIATQDRGKKALRVVATAGFGVLMLLFGAMAGIMPANYIAMPMAVGAVAAVGCVAACLLFAVRISKTQRLALRRATTLGLLLVLAAMVIINIVKIFWGRPRMRIMDDPDSQFTLWFLPQGFAASDEYKSFPSGHSANAACIIWITLLPTFLPRLNTRAAFTGLNCAAYAWIVLVMASRVVMGAHFASDVTMGAGITVFCFYMMRRRLARAGQPTLAQPAALAT